MHLNHVSTNKSKTKKDMKKLSVYSLAALLALAPALASCDDDDDDVVATASITTEVQNFVGTYFPGNSITSGVVEREQGILLNIYRLSGGYSVSFDSSNNWVELEGSEDRRIALPTTTLSLLPKGIQDYVASKRLSVWEVKRTATGYEVDLSDNTDAYFDSLGNLQRAIID